jgi:hypothetical protein
VGAAAGSRSTTPAAVPGCSAGDAATRGSRSVVPFSR